MRRFVVLIFFLALGGWLGWRSAAYAAEYHLINGDIVSGEPVQFNEQGFVVRLDIGGYTPRINWAQVTQESLKELAKIPEAREYAEAFIDIPPEVKAQERAKKRQIVLKEVPRVERPGPSHSEALAFVTTPAGLAIVVALFLANVYAAYEIARFRQRPPALVCSVSAILPVIGPILFLSMPPPESAYEEAAAPAPEMAEAPASIGNPLGHGPGAAPAPGGLSVAAHSSGPAATVIAGMSFKRGETTFNRRFFELTFPGFFRVVPSEAERDLVLAIKTARGEYVAKRISRISMTDVHVQTIRGGVEASVPFSEITDVTVRNKDAKA